MVFYTIVNLETGYSQRIRESEIEMSIHFHHLTRAIVVRDDQILVVHTKGEEHTFLPGGHIEFGESATTALKREMQEELGLNCNIIRFLGLVEHQWELEGKLQCEVNQTFLTEIPDLGENPISKEPKLEFFWVPIPKLSHNKLKPAPFCKLIPTLLQLNPPIWWESTLI
jgi:8-oxo-dGTP diphosphatase